MVLSVEVNAAWIFGAAEAWSILAIASERGVIACFPLIVKATPAFSVYLQQLHW